MTSIIILMITGIEFKKLNPNKKFCIFTNKDDYHGNIKINLD